MPQRRPVDWRAAVWSGLIAGVVFIVLDMTLVPLFGFGSPWEVVRMIAAIALGPDVLPPPATFDLGVFAVAMAVHFSLSILYALLRAWTVEGWMHRLPSLLQGFFGIAIYVINFYGFTRLFPWFADARSWVSLLVHASWAVVLPIVYHRLARPGRAGAVFDPAMRARAVRVLEIEAVIRRALDRGDFLLQYQPIVALGTGRIAGFEALLRVRQPERGTLPTSELIAAAEEAGLIVPVGLWTLREACRQLREWRLSLADSSDISVGVNLSAAHFAQEDLVETVERMLRENQLAGRFLKLEVAERAVMRDAEAAIGVLERLRTLGVRVAIDDFGTGYSSLAYLQRLPVGTLKIDRSFVSRLERGGRDLEIVRAIVTLAHAVDMDVVAEGVETPGQLAELKALGCEHGQGNLFSEPVSAEEAAALIDDGM